MKYAAWIFFFSLCIFTGCDKKDENVPTDNSSQPVQISFFPLNFGNKWIYYTEAKTKSALTGTISNLEQCRSTMEVVGDTFLNGQYVTKMAVRDSFYSGQINTGNFYLVNRPDGFYYVASTDGFIPRVDLRLSEPESFAFRKANNLRNGLQDSLYIPDSAITILKFPVVLSEQWHSARYSPGFYLDRKYIAYSTQITNAGIFGCVKVILFQVDSTGTAQGTSGYEMSRYYSVRGLIRSSISADLVIGGDILLFTIDSKLIGINF